MGIRPPAIELVFRHPDSSRKGFGFADRLGPASAPAVGDAAAVMWPEAHRLGQSFSQPS
jgi:hypothetical protein